MDERKIYKIIFKKADIEGFKYMYSKVPDSTVISVIKDLSESYNFKLVSVFMTQEYDSEINIKCLPSDIDYIFYDFCKKLGDRIKNTRYRRRLF